MREPSIEEHDRDPIVGRLADEFVERFRRGENPDLSEYVARAPEYAARVREAVDMALFLERLGSASSVGAGRIGPGVQPPDRLETIGEFRIIRELGRGGMGIVYEADHPSMGRRVALKVLPLRGVRDDGLVERFQNEIRATARLEHDNIVPIFESGRSGDFCYYAMQFVRGQALDQMLAEVRRVRARDFPETVAVRPESEGAPLSEVTGRLLGRSPEGASDGAAAGGSARGSAGAGDDVPSSPEEAPSPERRGFAPPRDDSPAVESGLGGGGSRPQD